MALRIGALEKKARRYGTGVTLCEAEIHIIKAIRENRGLHLSGLSQKLGVTKGAVSQIVMKLVKKGMVVKGKRDDNFSKIVLQLTANGETAYKNHQKLHAEFDKLVASIVETKGGEAGELVADFLDALADRLEQFEVDSKFPP